MELRGLLTASKEETNEQIKSLKDTIDKQSEIIPQHQLFLEHLDRQKRENNLVVFGIPEEREALDGATTDADKLRKVWSEIQVESDVEIKSYKRLGNTVHDNRPRPILLRVDSKEVRDKVLEKAKKLKDATDRFKKIYVKKKIPILK